MTGTDRSIVLVGFMGTGKSSVGQRLAHLTGRALLDTDAIIARTNDLPIGQIFEQFGEARFREEESAALHNLSTESRSIIVTGGGVVLRSANVARLRELGKVVCLTANLPTLVVRLEQGADRPLLAAENLAETVERLLSEREPLYKDAADLNFDTSALNPDQVAQSIMEALELTR